MELPITSRGITDWNVMTDFIYSKVSDFIHDESAFKKWLLTKEKVGKVVDPVMYGKLFLIHKNLEKFNDKVIVIVGREGSGKSTIANHLCAIMDESYEMSRNCFSPREFIHNLRIVDILKAINIDEGAIGLYSRESMNIDNRNMVKTFMVIRRKSLFVTVCIPDYSSLDSYIRNHRTSLLIYIMKRGHYIAFFGEGLQKINQDIQKMKNISHIKVSDGFFWHGYFRKDFPDNLNVVEYLEKKDKHIENFLEQMEKQMDDKVVQPQMVTIQQAATILNRGSESIRKDIANSRLEATKLGGKWYIHKKSLDKILNEVPTP
jgi:energy-coupling factor transporter ATP-binding protein EcfA2